MDIGKKIRQLRKQLDLNQTELADLLGVSQKTISSYEINRTQPTIEMIDKMCKVFNCKKTDFMDEQPSYALDLDKDEVKFVEHLREVPERNKAHLLKYMEYLRDLKDKED